MELFGIECGIDLEDDGLAENCGGVEVVFFSAVFLGEVGYLDIEFAWSCNECAKEHFIRVGSGEDIVDGSMLLEIGNELALFCERMCLVLILLLARTVQRSSWSHALCSCTPSQAACLPLSL